MKKHYFPNCFLAWGLSSAGILAFFWSNLLGGWHKTVFFLGGLPAKYPKRGGNWTRVKPPMTDPPWSRKQISKKCSQTRGVQRFYSKKCGSGGRLSLVFSPIPPLNSQIASSLFVLMIVLVSLLFAQVLVFDWLSDIHPASKKVPQSAQHRDIVSAFKEATCPEIVVPQSSYQKLSSLASWCFCYSLCHCRMV